MVLALYAALLNSHWRPIWDSAIYLTLAQSIVNGDGYRFMGYPHALYPPGLPLLLAGVLITAGRSYMVMRVIMLVTAALGATGAYFLVKSRVGPVRALLVSVAFAVSFPVVEVSTAILSDLPFACCALIALALCEPSPEPPRGWKLTAMAASILACIMLRTTAIALVAAIVLYGLSRWLHTRHAIDALRWVVVGATALAAAAIWSGYANSQLEGQNIPAGLPGYGYDNQTYLGQFMLADPTRSDSSSLGPGSYARRLRKNILFYVDAITEDLVGPGEVRASLGAAALAVLLLPLLGFYSLARSRAGPSELFFIVHMSLLLVWPWRYQRFLLPVLPLLFLYTLSGIEALAAALRLIHGRRLRGPSASQPTAGALVAGARPQRTLASAVAVAILPLLHLPADLNIIAHEHARPYPPSPGDRAIIEASEWVVENTGPQEVVVCFQAAIVHWLSGRPSLQPPWTHPPDVQLAMILESRADWLIINPHVEISGGYMRQLVARHPDLFSLRAVVERAEIYRVVTGPRAVQTSPGSPRARD